MKHDSRSGIHKARYHYRNEAEQPRFTLADGKESQMERSKLLPSVVLSVALIASSIILYCGMNRLGDKVIDAGIFSRQISLTRNNDPLRIVLDDGSELKAHASQDADQ